MGAWVIGHNLPGYLPESDTYAYECHRDAYDSFKEMCREYADRDDEGHDSLAEPDWSDDDYGSMRACVDSIISNHDDGSWRGGKHEAGMMVRDSDDRPISFWLVWSDDRDPAEDE